MISHLNIGTNDLERAEQFFTELLKLVDGQLEFKTERMLYFSVGGGAKLAVNKPFNGEPATAGNGTMVALAGSGPEQIQQVYARAMALGASCEGAPGERMGGAFYAAYFRDPDGNKFGIFCTKQA